MATIDKGRPQPVPRKLSSPGDFNPFNQEVYQPRLKGHWTDKLLCVLGTLLAVAAVVGVALGGK